MSFSLVDYANEEDEDTTALHAADQGDAVQADATMHEAESTSDNIQHAEHSTHENTSALASVADYEQVEEVLLNSA